MWTETRILVEKSLKDGKWEKVGEIDYALSGNKMELGIPLKLLELSQVPNIEFKWSDNMQHEGDIMDFLLHGDVAPLGRFNYFYQP
jgi:hypothetical protein